MRKSSKAFDDGPGRSHVTSKTKKKARIRNRRNIDNRLKHGLRPYAKPRNPLKRELASAPIPDVRPPEDQEVFVPMGPRRAPILAAGIDPDIADFLDGNDDYEPSEMQASEAHRAVEELASMPPRDLQNMLEKSKIEEKEYERKSKGVEFLENETNLELPPHMRPKATEDDDESEEEDSSESETTKNREMLARFRAESRAERKAANNTDDSEEEEDDDEAEAERNREYQEAVAEEQEMQEAMEHLKHIDPGFYKYIKETDPELTEFTAVPPEDDEELPFGDVVLTEEMLDSWKKGCVAGQWRALAKILSAFRSACHLKDPPEELQALQLKFVIKDSQTYNSVMMFCIKHMPAIFGIFLGRKPEKEHVFIPAKYSRWPSIRKPVVSFLSSLLNILKYIEDESMIVFILKNLAESDAISWIGCIPALKRVFLKVMLGYWSEGSERMRVLAFVIILEMAKKIPYPFINDCLRQSYYVYVKNARTHTHENMSRITFMRNCVVELCGIDFATTYTYVYTYIRQLTIVVRNTLKDRQKNPVKAVLNWQFFNSVRCWAHVLCAYPNQEGLQLLIYPIVMLIQAVLSLCEGPPWWPIRLQYIRLLNHIGATNDAIISAQTYLLQMLEYNRFLKKTVSTEAAVPLSMNWLQNYKCPEKDKNNPIYLDGVLDRVIVGLKDFYGTHAYSAAFPELVFPGLRFLKRFAKKCKEKKRRDKISGLTKMLEENARKITEARSNITTPPKELIKFNSFLLEEREKGKALSKLQAHGLRFKQTSQRGITPDDLQVRKILERERANPNQRVKRARNPERQERRRQKNIRQKRKAAHEDIDKRRTKRPRASGAKPSSIVRDFTLDDVESDSE